MKRKRNRSQSISMFFPKSPATFQDVIDFCNLQVSEGINLDYKKDLSGTKGIAKTICAFANTRGGTIIVGVEDDNNKPKLPVEGLEFTDKLNTQVIDIVLGNIFNPIIPNIIVCEPVNNKTFIIIEVPESNNAPHAIDNDTKIYFRTGDISNPEDLADIEKIKWLLNRREKSEKFREIIKSTAVKRFLEVQKRVSNHLQSPLICLSSLPFYPRESYVEPNKILSLVEGLEKEGYGRSLLYQFDFSNFIPVPQGIIKSYKNHFYYHCEINEFGLYYFVESIKRGNIPSVKSDSNSSEKVPGVWLFSIIQLIDLYLESLKSFYETIGFLGLVELEIQIDIKNQLVMGLLSDSYYSREIEEKTKHPLEDIHYIEVFSASTLLGNKENLFMKVVKKLCWDLGFSNIQEEQIDNFLKKSR